MSLETRSNSALMKRAEQLKRWQDSETFREPSEPKRKSRRIGFSDGCVFLAACAAGDREEVKVLLGRGADIDTANVDGLTALHQACIDDNLDMVEFLVSNGADVNRGDNEGWTPLHATASCGFLSIAKFLLDHGANVAAVNNDGELAIDISESDEMEDLLQKEIDIRQINCEDARNREEQCMLDDARDWYNSGNFGDRPHTKTGATALHVAAAKGYIKVINLLIQAGGEINQQDFDGWTPLHAAAHWAQREACELLAENYVNMDIKNCVGQTPFDVADPDVLRLLEELKKKQNTLQKDRPDIKALINRPPTTPGINKGGRSLNSFNSNHVDIIRNPMNSSNNVNAVTDRSSITRLSQQDKETIKQQVKETIKEEKVVTSRDTNESDKDSSTDTSESDDSSLSTAVSPRIDPFHSDTDIQTARIYQSSTVKPSRTLDSPGVVVTDESGKEAPGFLPPHPETNQGKDDSAPWRRPGSLRARPTNSGISGGKLSPSTEDVVTVRRAHSFGSDEKRKVSEDIITKQSPDLRPRSIENLSVSKSNPVSGAQPQPAQVRRSFVPPVRDEEHEIQRKAHAKRVRETRRSTQGVTLEDLKSAEQLVKKKQQQENAQRTTELQQLASSSPTAVGSTAATTTGGGSPSTPPGSTATTTVTTSATLVTGGSRDDQDRHERRPSWRLRIESNDKSRFTLEDTREKMTNSTTSTMSNQSPERRISRLDPGSIREQRHTVHTPHLGTTSTQGESEGSTSGTPTQLTAIQRKKKPKRRSTGVVQLELDDIDPRSEESADENVPTSSSQTSQDLKTRNNLKSQNGDIDYKKLWEESQAENARLRLDMNAIRSDLDSTRHQLEAAIQASAKNSVSDTEKREKKVLEKKLAEMEEELKQLQKLKSENEKLKSENRALTRVVSKLTAAATKSGPTQPSQGPQVRK